MRFDLVIHGGSIVTPESVIKTDIGIKGGKIEKWGDGLVGERRYDAHDYLVLPGAIDAHVHLEMPTATTRTSDDWYSGTRAAACGGTTTVIDFVEPEGNETLLEALALRQKQANGHTVVDYGLHMTLMNAKQEALAQIPDVINAGISSFKTYTTYPGFGMGDIDLLRAFEAVAAVDGLVLVHAENDGIIKFCTDQLISEKKLAPRHFPESRPALAEIEAIQRVILFARLTQTALYLVHISTAGGAQAVERARQINQEVYGETCPQYLILNEKCYITKDPIEVLKYVCSPPLRQQRDQDTLWAKLESGVLQTVCTDHCAFNLEGQKDQGLKNFLDVPGGLPGIEPRLSLIHTFGVKKGYLTLQQWVSLCCTNPSKIFGLYPKKGTLEVGADADIVIFDPNMEVVIGKDDHAHSLTLHENVDHTPYEDQQLFGWPKATFLRGELIAENQKMVAKKPSGKFLHRNIRRETI